MAAKRLSLTVPEVLNLLDGVSLDALEELADDPVPGSLVILACRVPALASHAAQQLARRLLGSAFRRDFAVLAPAGERWLVSEVEQVSRALQVFPQVRHVLVLEQAHEMDARARDRLLLALEEPPAPATVVLVVPDAGLVPSTLRGRASSILTLSPADAPAQADALVAAGYSASAARDALVLAGPLADLLEPLAASSAARAAVRDAASPRWSSSHPVRDAVSRVEACASAACLLSSKEPTAYGALDASTKVLARRLLRLLLDRRRAAIVSDLAAHAQVAVQEAASLLAAVDTAESQLRAGVSPVLVLAALASEGSLSTRFTT